MPGVQSICVSHSPPSPAPEAAAASSRDAVGDVGLQDASQREPAAGEHGLLARRLAEIRDRLRLATPADNDALVALMGAVPMEGELRVSTQRGPDFFQLYAMQRGATEVWAFDTASSTGEPRLGGCGAILVRDGFLGGTPRPCGYLGDLRSAGFTRLSRLFPLAFAEVLDGVRERHGCEHFLTGVMATNQAALSALTTKKKHRAGQPRYDLLARFDTVAVHFVWKKKPQVPSGLSVRTATDDDVGALADFLAEDHARRPFGWRFDDGELQHRLAHWPGYRLEQTYLCHDDRGHLVGATTCWDAAAVKRYRVHGYEGGMLWTKRGLDVGGRLLGFPSLPAPGHDFRYFYLANLSIKDDAPAVLRALLSTIYAEQHAAGYHFFAFPLYEGDPLAPALKGFIARRIPFHLYRVAPSTAPATPLSFDGRPGFEMALA
jgi:hypothetical protein